MERLEGRDHHGAYAVGPAGHSSDETELGGIALAGRHAVNPLQTLQQLGGTQAGNRPERPRGQPAPVDVHPHQIDHVIGVTVGDRDSVKLSGIEMAQQLPHRPRPEVQDDRVGTQRAVGIESVGLNQVGGSRGLGTGHGSGAADDRESHADP